MLWNPIYVTCASMWGTIHMYCPSTVMKQFGNRCSLWNCYPISSNSFLDSRNCSVFSSFCFAKIDCHVQFSFMKKLNLNLNLKLQLNHWHHPHCHYRLEINFSLLQVCQVHPGHYMALHDLTVAERGRFNTYSSTNK